MVYCNQVYKFIEVIQSDPTTPSFDKPFLKELSAGLSDNVYNELTSKQVDNVLLVFRKRWEKVFDTEYDYTFHTSEVNKHWINLAKAFANDGENTYLHILIPTVTNTLDPTMGSKLIEFHDLRGFFFADNGVLHRLRGVMYRILEKKPAAVYDSDTNQVLRGLAVCELFRIQAKVGKDLAFTHNDVHYKSFWDFLVRFEMPLWQQRGQYPDLLGLYKRVKTYLESNNRSLFESEYKAWLSKVSSTSSIDDINYLYGAEIEIDGKKAFLINLLIDLYYPKDEERFGQTILVLAHWLDKTLSSDLLSSLLVSRLQKLTKKGAISNKVNCLVQRLKKNWQMTEDVLEQLQEIYKYRWDLILDTELDYLQKQNGENIEWIKTAKIISDSGLLKDKDYYQLLMPTIEASDDPVQYTKLSEKPLSHYILASDNCSLILLENCEKHLIVDGTFYNCNTIPPVPLTKKELHRLKHATQDFAKYLAVLEKERIEHDPPLKESTVQIICDLVSESCYPSSLVYDEPQMHAAQKAYQRFYAAFAKLPEAEKQKLNAQQVICNGRKRSFAEVMQSVSDGHCIVICGQYFAQMVMDYAPFWKFNEEIESRFKIENMRSNSRKKVFAEYHGIDKKEAMRRILAITSVILLKKFNIPFLIQQEKISRFDFSNQVPFTVKKMFNLIASFLESDEDSEHILFLYVLAMESVIKPVLNDASLRAWFLNLMGWNANPIDWFKSIHDESFFKESNFRFEYEQLFMVTWKTFKNTNKLNSRIDDILDRLIKIDLLKIKANNKAMQANVTFFKLVEHLEAEDKHMLLDKFKQNGNHCCKREYVQSCAQYLSYRIRCFTRAVQLNHSSQKFFMSNASMQCLKPADGFEMEGKKTRFGSLTDLINSMHDNLEKKAVPNSGMVQYWQNLTGKTLTCLSQAIIDSSSQSLIGCSNQ